MFEIFNFQYYTDMGCGGDVWRYRGFVSEHPCSESGNISPSSPVEFDEENLILVTQSGSHYKIMSFAGDKITIINQIKSDIKNGGFEIH